MQTLSLGVNRPVCETLPAHGGLAEGLSLGQILVYLPSDTGAKVRGYADDPGYRRVMVPVHTV